MRVMFPIQPKRQSTQLRLVGQTLGVVQALSGVETVVPAMGARWVANITLLLRNEAEHLAYAAFVAGMEGRLGATLVPCPSRFRPLDRDGKAQTWCDVAGLQGAQTFEHFGFANDVIAQIVLAETAALRATRIKVAAVDSTGLRPGQYFTLGERLYQVQLSWVDGADTVVQFQPPLRAGASAGEVLDVASPHCLMRRADDADGGVELTFTKMQSVSLSFVEAV